MFDLILKNARVIDPETGFDETASVAVSEGRTSRIASSFSGSALNSAKDVIDGEGLILAPGFIDIHAHEDVLPRSGQKVLPAETAKAALKQGVTTMVTGNCGISDFPLLPYRIRVARAGIPIYTPFFVGNIPLRFAVGLDFYKEASPAQINLMTLLERIAFRDGAIGISFGLQYAPGTGFDEMCALAKVAAECGKLMSVHMRYDYTEKAVETVKEVIDVAEKTGVSLQISHLAANAYGEGVFEKVRQMIEDSPRRHLVRYVSIRHMGYGYRLSCIRRGA